MTTWARRPGSPAAADHVTGSGGVEAVGTPGPVAAACHAPGRSPVALWKNTEKLDASGKPRTAKRSGRR